MYHEYLSQLPDVDPAETQEWMESLDGVLDTDDPQRAAYIVRRLWMRARQLNIGVPAVIQTPYINTIPPEEEPYFPGDGAMEKRIRQIVRWNAMAMVHRANKRFEGLGGHISTYASSASLFEVGFNHFFKGADAQDKGDQVYFQGHGAPGIYARAFLEGRLTTGQLDHFRRETSGKGLSSYPHPWLMKDFWQFPTVSMGLGPISAIYQARFNRYLEHRGIKPTAAQRVWFFGGDGETDEVESRGALHIAAKENLDNLTFVINCNLQRLDGPVRGNGKIIQELESTYAGAGWNVIKVIWGPEWNKILKDDVDGLLVQKMNETPDGQFQKYSVESGAYIRDDFFGPDPRLRKLVDHLSDDNLKHLRRGGHSYKKLYAAYTAATNHTGAPTVILAKTIKGWTLGDAFAGANTTHSMKKLSEAQLRKFRDTLELPISDDKLAEAPYFHPGMDSPEVKYMLARRQELGGSIPARSDASKADIQLKAPKIDAFAEFFKGTKEGVATSTTMVLVRLMRTLMRDKEIGKYMVPIIPDEGRTFGMDALFKEAGIYAPQGQLYTPVDSKMLFSYRESSDGQILQEGITEAGSMASFTAAGTSYSTHGVPMIPFYLFYSMFGLQRTGDQSWAFGDNRGRGFLIGATAGRTTLNGEGLQHQDGHTHLMAQTIPNMIAYDAAYHYELAVIVREGLRRMLENNEDLCYYLTVYNENISMPTVSDANKESDDFAEGILKGAYVVSQSPNNNKAKAQLFGSGPLLQSSLAAQQILLERYSIATDVWSITSYQQLYRDARSTDRSNRLKPSKSPQVSFLVAQLKGHQGPIIATSDWVSEQPALLAGYCDRRVICLGSNGFGRSDTREALRKHFEIDAHAVVYNTLVALFEQGDVTKKVVTQAAKDLEIDLNAPDPMFA